MISGRELFEETHGSNIWRPTYRQQNSEDVGPWANHRIQFLQKPHNLPILKKPKPKNTKPNLQKYSKSVDLSCYQLCEQPLNQSLQIQMAQQKRLEHKLQRVTHLPPINVQMEYADIFKYTKPEEVRFHNKSNEFRKISNHFQSKKNKKMSKKTNELLYRNIQILIERQYQQNKFLYKELMRPSPSRNMVNKNYK